SSCSPHFSNLHRSDEETSLIEVVPIGVYYNIPKCQPNWINLEPLACQRLNQVHRKVMLAAITFNVATSLEPCVVTLEQPHIGDKSTRELKKMNKSQAFHKETQNSPPKHVFGSWSSWHIWAAGAVGQLSSWEQLREVCFTSQKGG
ncbi:unnamed protein product, partial [Prunus brigantina]